MKLARPVLALAVGASVVLAGSAGALTKPKPVCNLIKDGAGDAGVVTAQDSMDILSADIASDKRKVTAVIRLKGHPAGTNPQAIGGTNYYFNFIASGSTNVQYLNASVPFNGAPKYATGQIVKTGGQNVSTDDSSSGATGSIKGNVITITAPVSSFVRVNARPGAKLSNLTAEVRVLIGAADTGSLVLADDATGAKPYTAGALSCVRPGS